MEYINSLKWRYATKKFDSQKLVDEEKVNRIVQAANLSASSMGLQPIKLVNVQDKHLRSQLLSACHNQKQIVDASHVFIICAETNITDERIDWYIDLVAKTRNQEVESLAAYRNSISNVVKSFESEDLKLTWLAKQAYIVMGTLLTACAIEKVDSCPMEGFIPTKVSEILDLESKHLVPILVLPIGYRSAEDGFQHNAKVRQPINDYLIKL